MSIFKIKPVFAHCDLPCGVYDPAQAMIEAKSILEIIKKYPNLDSINQQRAIIIKEQRAELVKNHLMILWADYFKAEHLEKYPNLHNLFWLAIKQASETKKGCDQASAEKLIAQIDEISQIFFETKKA